MKNIFKYIWNNRRSNGWLLAELFLVFIILWYAVDYLLMASNVHAEPKGYNTHQVYHVSVEVNPNLREEYQHTEAWTETYLQMFRQIREYPGVEAGCYYGGSIPYENSAMFQGYTTDSIHTYLGYIRMVSSGFFEVFEVDIEEGGIENWDIATYPRPAVISRDLADSLFNGKPQIGRPFTDYYMPSRKYTVGAIAAQTKLTEYDRYRPFIYVPSEEWMLTQWSPMIAIRVRENATEGFAERFTADMRSLAIGPFIFSQITSYDEAKEIMDTQVNNYIRTSFSVLLFFVFNVFLGIIGTFWFRTRKRKAEIGLRMALGASRKQISAELAGEGMLLLLIAVVPAVAICFNVWFADLTVNNWMDTTPLRLLIGITGTLLLMVAMVLAGISYPARQAMKIEPATALHDE